MIPLKMFLLLLVITNYNIRFEINVSEINEQYALGRKSEKLLHVQMH